MKFHSATEKNLSQSKLSKMHFSRNGAREHETRSDLCFEVKQILGLHVTSSFSKIQT